ncbi:Protein CBG27114 [Caenorhabditis briggsae]|uniref:Protein CBG27114 n=1 Tax=Caenorhabditis briggsae TaxID=6238 RepID=B6IHI8_CAEBR|nr:Protein CBG27114 [Caenorhabditis briggsae]CAR99368.1 Protein CBG27114 [Caenorhabditis briggsae]
MSARTQDTGHPEGNKRTLLGEVTHIPRTQDCAHEHVTGAVCSLEKWTTESRSSLK